MHITPTAIVLGSHTPSNPTSTALFLGSHSIHPSHLHSPILSSHSVHPSVPPPQPCPWLTWILAHTDTPTPLSRNLFSSGRIGPWKPACFRSFVYRKKSPVLHLHQLVKFLIINLKSLLTWPTYFLLTPFTFRISVLNTTRNQPLTLPWDAPSPGFLYHISPLWKTSPFSYL